MIRLQELRAQKGITMKEAAARLGMPYTTYVNYEKGLREPSSETLILLADFYETTVDQLLGRDADTAAAAQGPQAQKERKLQLLARRAAGLPEAEYDRILKKFEDTIELYLQARGIDPEGK